MTTSVSGLIKIGKTGLNNYEERMRFLESNGYYNVGWLKRFFAIKLEEYDEKESLLHDLFDKYRVANSELFALDYELVSQLLLAFEWEIIYPKSVDKEKEFDELSEVRKENNRFSFYKKWLKNGDEINFISDKSIVVKIVGETEVEYGGQNIKLSPLTYKILEQKNKLNSSGAYHGAAYFEYKGKKLTNINNITE